MTRYIIFYLIFILNVVAVSCRIAPIRFYSDPMEMMAQRPDGYYDPYGERLQQLKDEYLKRRMADAIIRPYPLAYSVFDDDTVLSDSVAGNRNRWNTISTFSNMFTGKKK